MDRIGSVAAFVRAAETLSFKVAGQRMGVSSSAVGKAVLRLEERLGVRLLNRSTRSISLTPEGELFLARCERILQEIEAAEHELAQASSTPRGRLRVSLPLVGSLMMPAINRFASSYPEIELELDFTDRIVDVIEEGFDTVIRTGSVTDSLLMTRKLGTFDYVVVGSPAYFAKAGVPKRPADLAGHSCLHHSWTATKKLERWPLSVDGNDLDLELPRTVVASTLEPLISMAEDGLGVTCLPRFTVRRQLEAGTLVSVLDGYLAATGTFRILWPPNRHPAPKVRAFVDFMAEHLFAALETSSVDADGGASPISEPLRASEFEDMALA